MDPNRVVRGQIRKKEVDNFVFFFHQKVSQANKRNHMPHFFLLFLPTGRPPVQTGNREDDDRLQIDEQSDLSNPPTTLEMSSNPFLPKGM